MYGLFQEEINIQGLRNSVYFNKELTDFANL